MHKPRNGIFKWVLKDAALPSQTVLQPQTHLAWVDHLRGMSAFFIVLFHVRVYMWVGLEKFFHGSQAEKHTLLEKGIASIFILSPFMGSAVMLFFLLSGFSIHYTYAGRSRNLNLKEYAMRRFFRVYPPYVAAVVFTVLVEAIVSRLSLKGGDWNPAHLTTIIGTLFMFQNYLVPLMQFPSNPAFWSLPVEVEFYIMFPLLYALWRRTSTQITSVVVVVTSCIAFFLSVTTHFGWVLNNFAAYWTIWFAGVLLAERFRTQQLPRWYTVYYYLTLLFFGSAAYQDWRHPHNHALLVKYLWATGYFFVILRILTSKRTFLAIGEEPRNTLKAKVFAAIRNGLDLIGKLSYSLYLTHYPLIYLFGALWIKQYGTKPDNPIWPLLASLLTIGFAFVFYHLFEYPSHRYGKTMALRFART